MADITTSQSIVRESPEVEAYKLDLLKNARGLAYNVDPNTGAALPATQSLAANLPAYQVAGFSPAQQAALNAASSTGIGAFNPYLDVANTALAAGYKTTQEAADALRTADTRGQFYNAQQDINSGINALAGMQNLAAQSAQANLVPATSAISQGLGGLSQAQGLALQARAADLQPSNALLASAANQTANLGTPNYYAAQSLLGGGLQQGATGLATAQGLIGGGVSQSGAGLQAAQGLIGGGLNQSGAGLQAAQGLIGGGLSTGNAGVNVGVNALANANQAYNPIYGAAFQNPYQQQVIDRTMLEMDRQAAIAQQAANANAVRAGAFGGTREGVQRAEMQRNVMDQKANTIANLLNQGYTQSQAQAQQAFEQQQQRQMQAGTGIGALTGQQAQLGLQAGQALGALSGQQGQLGLQAGQTLGALAGQQGQLGLQAGQAVGGLSGQQAQLGLQAGQALAGMQTQEAQLGLQGAGQLANIGQTLGQQAIQQAQLGQGAAAQYGSLANQQVAAGQGLGQLGVQQAQLGQGAAGIYGNAAGLYGNLAGQTGALAGQQFGIGQQIASGLGALGAQAGQFGINQAALGQTAQNMNQNDINFLYNTGQSQQALNQQILDAQRATQLQQAYAPYQAVGFLSDVYRGAPSTQMSTAVSSQPSASPFQQAVGIGLGAASTLAGAKKLGVL